MTDISSADTFTYFSSIETEPESLVSACIFRSVSCILNLHSSAVFLLTQQMEAAALTVSLFS